MSSAASLTGVMCRILLLTSVAYNDTNQITLEFSTPRFVAPSSMFFCFTTTSITLTADTFTILELKQGGTIFTVNESTEVGPYSDFASTSFFSSGTGELNAVEISTVYEVLGTDPFYGGSFKLQRYDDLVVDQQGIPIRGVADFPVDPAAPPGGSGGGPQIGNCFLLTGSWQADSRYQMTLRVTNPLPPTPAEVPYPPPPLPSPSPPPLPSPLTDGTAPPTSPPQPSPPSPAPPPPGPQYMLYSNNATPILWVAPVTYEIAMSGNGSVTNTLLFSVRGNKYGAACPLRPAIVPYMGTMFDACAEASKRGLDGNGTVTPGIRDTLPFTAPPLTPYTLTSFGATSCTASSGQVLGPRLGGECITCGLYGIVQNGSCTCPSHILSHRVGAAACGDPISPDGSARSIADLPAWLCNTFTTALNQWKAKRLLDHIVAKQYIQAFTQAAGPLLDYTAVYEAFQTFNSTLIFDSRRPNSPTRAHGIKPNCNRCTAGAFKDVYTKKMTPVFDWHFDAMNTFRFIGYVLDKELGAPCPDLWNSSNPKEWNYGYYDQIICKPMPPETCCGANFYGTTSPSLD
ncbi:hypothetical protein VOLCADRAFT_107220 [Volvox carteri f. nagariensis]|uniref:Uncharacterized protein n=1 Tax=Volvox carteri f. nagariensis TaxID=3068 RepID=D8UCP2_VOLCA|nr:uncharacterized protein VOLCADRAFT_107220 [Volvox carteri f. nagariensis]EFJ42586.1 hypothetical protein VOLCADRAFT_107220 [Volvox carteri f. nagariensis]|eukprot:XP_002956442.1 hypothetical protein VOLCADRAFT_107220 [Volvox carteri f. nagariensis]